MRQIFNICLVAQLVAAMSAQELRWNLPPHGAAIYQRTWQQETSAEPKSADHNVPGLDQNSAPVVLSDELDAKGMQTTEPVLHMRALFPLVALNLAFVKPCKVAVKLNQQLRNAAMNAEAEYGPLSNSGEQTIAVTLGPGPKETVRLPGNNGGPQISGKIIGKRMIDRTNGRVASFTAKFELNYEFQNPARIVHLDATESWTFDKVLAHGDAEFRSMVTAGIRKAVAALRTELKSQLGQPLKSGGDPHFNIRTGQLALLLLSLVKGVRIKQRTDRQRLPRTSAARDRRNLLTRLCDPRNRSALHAAERGAGNTRRPAENTYPTRSQWRRPRVSYRMD